MKTKNKCGWIPPHPRLQCWWFLSVLSVQKKRSFMFAQVDDAYACNIEVGGVGVAVWKRSYSQRALFLHDPVSSTSCDQTTERADGLRGSDDHRRAAVVHGTVPMIMHGEFDFGLVIDRTPSNKKRLISGKCQ